MIKLFNRQPSTTPAPEPQPSVETLTFQPLPGFGSPHAQTVLAYLSPAGSSPPSIQQIISLNDGNALCCEVSTPPSWKATDKTVHLVHGLGGSHTSSYMIRISRKLFQEGIRTVRINMRCSGSGTDLADKPYHGGLSSDILAVIEFFHTHTPLSPTILIGFSLGGNIALKLSAELGSMGPNILRGTIAVCPPVDLAETAAILSQSSNRLYNRYYMRQLEGITNKGKPERTFSTIYEFDTLVTAPNWGFKTPEDYYRQNSSRYMLSMIQLPCYILLAIDDPFINHYSCLNVPRSPSVKIYLCQYGGHVGFFGWANEEHRYFWLDWMLMKWIKSL